MTGEDNHRTRTLWLCGILHACTHIYHVALMPLYLLIERDLGLKSVDQATLLLTLMMFAYFAPSYAMGALADRLSRKKLLAAGLTINSLGFVGLAASPNYPCAAASVMVAGFGGSFFHPAATSLIARLYPVNTGRALGLIGVGASVGFFVGPIYSGWRAAQAGWRAPVFEFGLLGLAMAGLFFWLAQEETDRVAAPRGSGPTGDLDSIMGQASRLPTGRPAPESSRPGGPPVAGRRSAPLLLHTVADPRLFPTPAVFLLFVTMSLAFGLRDFVGSSVGSLGSLFLQNARGFDLRQTGLALSAIFVASAVSNPLFGHLSDKGRIRWTCGVLLVAAALVAVFPRVPVPWLVPTLALYGFFFMASYPMVEAALMESVPDAVRGRAFGFFITAAGMIGNLSHWLMGSWVKGLGERAHTASAYYPLYGILSGVLLLSLLGLPCLHALRNRGRPEANSASGPAPFPDPQFE